MQLGFIGIGVMGRPMTLNLLKAGHDVTVYARHPDKPEVQEVLNAGAKLAPSSRAVAMASEVVITMVPNSMQVEEVVAGPQGILEGSRKDLVIIDMSTIAPAMSRKLAENAASKGVHFLDAPVSGGSQGAINGTLTIMVGGDREILERVRPILEAMGKKENIFYVGPTGTGEIVKIINNMLTGTISASVAEAFVLGTKAGADVDTMAKIISVSTGGNWQLSNQFPLRAFNGSFKPGFMVDLLHKDLGLALDLAAENQTPVAMTALARQMYEMVRAAGYGRDDYTSLMKMLEEMVGVEVRSKSEK
ncbi:2-hydroxy-3-oxopropionate reductase [Reticulibacter mediterranei]|uniref:2-hydroxy-3-oxopropionate reductase n=1 Tax=Reticulibacter mediterranei TaxID=2778369 RepID=A0A8J3IF12_9CHLR|nr:NAD(P)-dependent oxidoreductase [Reticulibacter mediterranei]GHO91303.1 2-hydroxy-3-oxopropionate reductase [Reticulibacter mediterranei]